MTPFRFQEILDVVNISDTQMMRWFNLDTRLIRRWKTGERVVPQDIAAWLETLLMFMEANPPPPTAYGRARENNIENNY